MKLKSYHIVRNNYFNPFNFSQSGVQIIGNLPHPYNDTIGAAIFCKVKGTVLTLHLNPEDINGMMHSGYDVILKRNVVTSLQELNTLNLETVLLHTNCLNLVNVLREGLSHYIEEFQMMKKVLKN